MITQAPLGVTCARTHILATGIPAPKAAEVEDVMRLLVPGVFETRLNSRQIVGLALRAYEIVKHRGTYDWTGK